jgi:hypothetical protein
MRDGEIIESLTTEQLEGRYSEIICRPPRAWTSPPVLRGCFGWQQIGEEWSVVVDSKESDENPTWLAEECSMIERRGITLQRWFTARSQPGRVRGDTTTLGEVAADV